MELALHDRDGQEGSFRKMKDRSGRPQTQHRRSESYVAAPQTLISDFFALEGQGYWRQEV